MKKNPTALLKRLDLPPGAWQMFWLGRLTDVPQAQRAPFIKAYLSQVFLDNDTIVQRSTGVRHVELPVSDLVAMPLGTVFDDTRIMAGLPLSKRSTWKNITVDFTRENLEVVLRKGSGSAAPLLDLGRKALIDDDEYEGLLVTAREGDNPAAYVFPCVTIFQFFWARSSKWAQMMVDGRFVDYDRYIFDPRRSHLSGNGQNAMIWLRQWMLDDDAAFIASLAFDEYALKAGSDIYLNMARGGSGDRRRCIRALPPYQGKLQMNVLCQTVQTRRGEATLIQHIGSCDYVPSIKQLDFDRDNDGRRLDDALAAEKGEKIPMSREFFGGPPSTVLAPAIELDDQPSSNKKESVEVILVTFDQRFPFFEEMTVKKLPQTDQEYINVEEAQMRLRNWTDKVSTLIDSSSSAKAAPEALIRAQDYAELAEADDITPPKGDLYSLAEGLLTPEFFPVMVGDTEWRATISTVPMPSLRGHFFTIQARVHGEKLTWLYRDKGNLRTKRALCLEVMFENQVSDLPIFRYLLDIEPREGAQQHSILLFWARNGAPLRHETLTVRGLVESIAKNKGPKISRGEMQNLQGRLRDHPKPHRLFNFLTDLFNAVDKM